MRVLFFLALIAGCHREAPAVVRDDPPRTKPCPSFISVPLDLPKASVDELQNVVLLLDIDATGKITMDGEPVANDAEITERAKKARAKSPELRLIVRADSAASYGRVILAVDRARMGGIAKIAFSMAMPGPP